MSWVSWSRAGICPLAPFAEGYGAELTRVGFAANSVVIDLSVTGQLSRWISTGEVAVEVLCVARMEEFFEARRAGGQRRVPTARMLNPLVEYLTARGVVPPPPPVSVTPLEALLERSGCHLVEVRGLAASTVALGRLNGRAGSCPSGECGDAASSGTGRQRDDWSPRHSDHG